MPHITVHMMPGRSEAQKQDLTEALVKVLQTTVGAGEDSISVEIVDQPNWPEYYRAEIAPNLERLQKIPGYTY
ncbi:tautomerase family protein [Donghicola mangrovi]|uniref:4-oxalocrotonate tautomerase n=1 Tax=Donghicola mangrovi TaxID=2729614 RepID=A0A850QES4_9RHOB|nr:tautomerase family protein [Donghicola mangrovi]NVO25450.1 4-oxalocrotonate tautomerase [Donghicola mangrovi]